MAITWVPMDLEIHKKPEFIIIMQQTGMSREQLEFMLKHFWGWVKRHAERDGPISGFVPGVTTGVVSAACPQDVRIASAPDSSAAERLVSSLLDVGWLIVENGGVRIPKADKYVSSAAQRKLNDMDRKQQMRNNPARVRTPSSPGADERGTRDRDRVSNPPKPPSEEPEEKIALPILGDRHRPTWTPPEAQVEAWQRAFPSLDVSAQLRAAAAHLAASPHTRLTAAGAPSWVREWLSKADDAARKARQAPQDAPGSIPRPHDGPGPHRKLTRLEAAAARAAAEGGPIDPRPRRKP